MNSIDSFLGDEYNTQNLRMVVESNPRPKQHLDKALRV